MSGDQPTSNDWASPGYQPADAPPVAPGTAPGWGSLPPPPPPPPPGYGGYAGYGAPPPYGYGIPQAPRPGVIPLRPLGVGELLDGAFTTIRRYPAATLGLSAAVMLVVQLVQLVTTYYFLNGVDSDTTTAFGNQPNGDYLARAFTVEGIVLVVTFVATVLLTGMLTIVLGQAVLGRPMGIKAAWQGVRPLIWRLIGATIVVPLVIFLAFIVGALPGLALVLISLAAGHSLAVVGIVVAIIGGTASFVFGIYLSICLSLTTQSLVLEKLGIRASMRRSRTLVKSSWWRIFGITLLAQLIAGIMAGIIVIPFDLAGGLGNVLSGDNSGQFNFTPLLLTGIGGLLSSTLVRPFQAGVLALLYIDRRMRAEALDLTLQQAAATPTP